MRQFNYFGNNHGVFNEDVEKLEREIETLMRGETAGVGHRDRLDNDIVNMKTHNRTNTTGFDFKNEKMLPKHESVGAAPKQSGSFGNMMGQRNFLPRKVGQLPSKTVY